MGLGSSAHADRLPITNIVKQAIANTGFISPSLHLQDLLSIISTKIVDLSACTILKDGALSSRSHPATGYKAIHAILMKTRASTQRARPPSESFLVLFSKKNAVFPQTVFRNSINLIAAAVLSIWSKAASSAANRSMAAS